MAVMVSSCMAFGRLAQDREILALRSTGVNPLVLNILPLTISIALTLGMIWFNNHILPEANHRVKNIMIDMVQKKPVFKIKALVTMKDLEGYDMQVADVDYKKSEITRIKLFDKATGREIFANSGVFYTDSTKITLLLRDGEIHELLDSGRYRKLAFDEQYIYIPIDKETIQRDREYRGERELSARSLKDRIKVMQVEKRQESQPKNAYKSKKIDSLLVEYHKKYSIPFACFAFVLLGCPLAIRVRKGGMGAGFGLALLFFIFYYVCLIGGEHLGDRGTITPWIAMWFPNIVLTIIGAWATYFANK
jgi:lipopolysaccharide export LptBFGC system permease protein LptF